MSPTDRQLSLKCISNNSVVQDVSKPGKGIYRMPQCIYVHETATVSVM